MGERVFEFDQVDPSSLSPAVQVVEAVFHFALFLSVLLSSCVVYALGVALAAAPDPVEGVQNSIFACTDFMKVFNESELVGFLRISGVD